MRPTRLNLGSGADYRDDHLNVERFADSHHHRGDTVPPDVFADAHHLPFADNAFEHATARHVIEHFERPLDALRELHRVLRPGGSVYVEVPDAGKVAAERDEHLYSWTHDTLHNIVHRAGFTHLKYEAVGTINHAVRAVA